MLNLVKTFPSSPLITSEPTNSGALEVSPEVPIRRLPVENQEATRDRACKCCIPEIRVDVVKSFREAGGGCKVLRDGIFIPGGGGGIVSGQVMSGSAFIGIPSHRCRAEYPVAFT